MRKLSAVSLIVLLLSTCGSGASKSAGSTGQNPPGNHLTSGPQIMVSQLEGSTGAIRWIFKIVDSGNGQVIKTLNLPFAGFGTWSRSPWHHL